MTKASKKGTIQEKYKYWQIRIMYGMLGSYAVFYFVRKNFSSINKELSVEFGFTAEEIGIVLSISPIAYAISKLMNGFLADILNPKYLIGIGLLASGIINIFCGFTYSLVFFTLFLTLNNFFQGTGASSCSRLLTNWYSPLERGKAWGVWNASHQIGGAIILIVSPYIILSMGWRFAFFIPGVIAIGVALWAMERLRKSPEAVGLPSIEEHALPEEQSLSPPPKKQEGEEAKSEFWPIFKTHILKNKAIWIISLANMFVYIVRIALLDWGPRFLQESKGLSQIAAGWGVGVFEITGIFGAFLAGYLSDNKFKGRRSQVSVWFMVVLVASVVGILYVQPGQTTMIMIILALVGFFVYGPQLLVAVAATDFASKEAAGTAVGVTGLFGYIGAAISGYSTGFLVTRYNWDAAFLFWIISGIIGTVLFLFLWNKKGETFHEADT